MEKEHVTHLEWEKYFKRQRLKWLTETEASGQDLNFLENVMIYREMESILFETNESYIRFSNLEISHNFDQHPTFIIEQIVNFCAWNRELSLINPSMVGDDAVRLYILEILKHPPLTIEEERVCFGEMHADSKIKKRVAQAHLSIVVSISANYLNQGLQFLDLINEGNIGLMRAMDKYDESKGYHFSEYATWWIRQSITRSIADQAKLIRVPVHMWDSIGSFKRHIKKLTNELGREPSHEELATEMNMPVEKIKDIFRITHDPISVDIDV